MFYIVGLGNPGEQYATTRHNVGFMVLDALTKSASLPTAVFSQKYAGCISEGVLGGTEVALLYPETFMNNSGSAVRKLVPAGEYENLIVVYDDVDLPVGTIKVSYGKGAGGHNGVQSIITTLHTKEFIRVRVGVAGKSLFGHIKRPVGGKLAKHVLGEFKTREQEPLADAVATAATAVATIVTEGVTAAMNRFN